MPVSNSLLQTGTVDLMKVVTVYLGGRSTIIIFYLDFFFDNLPLNLELSVFPIFVVIEPPGSSFSDLLHNISGKERFAQLLHRAWRFSPSATHLRVPLTH